MVPCLKRRAAWRQPSEECEPINDPLYAVISDSLTGKPHAFFEVALLALECSVCDSGGTACRSGKLCRVSDRKLIWSLPLPEIPPIACDVARQVSDGCATQAGCASMCHPWPALYKMLSFKTCALTEPSVSLRLRLAVQLENVSKCIASGIIRRQWHCCQNCSLGILA